MDWILTFCERLMAKRSVWKCVLTHFWRKSHGKRSSIFESGDSHFLQKPRGKPSFLEADEEEKEAWKLAK